MSPIWVTSLKNSDRQVLKFWVLETKAICGSEEADLCLLARVIVIVSSFWRFLSTKIDGVGPTENVKWSDWKMLRANESPYHQQAPTLVSWYFLWVFYCNSNYNPICQYPHFPRNYTFCPSGSNNYWVLRCEFCSWTQIAIFSCVELVIWQS